MNVLDAVFSVLCLGHPAGGGDVLALKIPLLATPLGQVATVVAVALIAWFLIACYRKEAAALAPGRRNLLIALRFAAALVLLWMASGAHLDVHRDDGDRPILELLVDRSASMALPEKSAGNATRDQQLRTALDRPDGLLARLARRHRLEGFTFGQGSGLTPQTLGDAAAGHALEAVTAPAENATRLGDALADAGRRAAGRRVAGILVASDGGSNLGEDPVAVAQHLGLPIFAIGVGQPRSRDLEVAFVFCEPVVFKNDRFAFEVRLRHRGYAGLAVPLRILRTNAAGVSDVVREETITFSAEGELTKVLDVVPDQEGVFSFSAELPAQGDEANTVNNRRVRAGVRVVDGKLRLLVAERAPRWEWRFLKGALDADRQRFAPAYLLQQGDPGERGLRRLPADAGQWRNYDAAILGDLDLAAVTPGELAALDQWVKVQGGGLLVIAGRQGGLAASNVISALLPVECDAQKPVRPEDERDRPLRQGVRIQPAADATDHPLLRLDGDPARNRQAWAGSEPLTWFQPVRRLRSGATALLVHPTLKAGDGPMPVLAAQRYGRGQVLWLASDETWRWRFHPGATEHRRFWGQMASNLGLAHLLGDAARVQVETERSDYAVGESVGILARVLDQALNPVVADHVGVTVERDLTRERVVLAARPGQPGVFAGEWIAGAVGSWRIAVEGASGADVADRRISVSEPQRELDDAGCREDLLERLATASGGAYRPLAKADELDALIQARAKAGARQLAEIPVWNAPGLILLFALLLGLEWFLRKRSDLL